MKTKIGNYNKHIDNGGIKIEINQDQFKQISIEFSTQYFGYPSVSATLAGCLTPEMLRNIGLMFIQAADKVKIEE